MEGSGRDLLGERFDRSGVHMLLCLNRDPQSKTPGEFPIAWTKNYSQGKIFVSLLGHRKEMWEDSTFQKHVLGGLIWALGLEQPGQADKAQAEPADRLTNSLGMVFVPVPGADVKFSIWETRVQDFEALVKATGPIPKGDMLVLKAGGWPKLPSFDWRNPGYRQEPAHPVVGVSWNDAQTFCQWLTDKGRSEGKLKPGERYRLPTDLEWSLAVGLTNEQGETPAERAKNARPGEFHWGRDWPPPSRAGNFAGQEAEDTDLPNIITGYADAYPRTAPVGSFEANRHGLHDMEGNVLEWCQDVFDGNSAQRVLRWGAWHCNGPGLLSASFRTGVETSFRAAATGFRVVLASDAQINPAESAVPIKLREGFVSLFNGRDFTGWKFSDSSPQKRSWTVVNGTMVNRGEDRTRACSIFTEQNYRDFVLYLEFNLPPRGNSGVYLRGRHEVQLCDDAAFQVANNQRTGAIYKEIAPSVVASKPAGEWQTLEVTLIGDRVSVTLNGFLVIKDGQLSEPYQSAMPAIDRTAPGPIYLQGNIGSVSFRNLRIKSLP
jgi:formylglycine-generating enzyme required for sulfatase activity